LSHAIGDAAVNPPTSSLEAVLDGLAVALMLPTVAPAYSYNEVPSGNLAVRSLGARALGSITVTGRVCGSSLPGVTRADVNASGDFNGAFSP
jgi:hypothetical protein